MIPVTEASSRSKHTGQDGSSVWPSPPNEASCITATDTCWLEKAFLSVHGTNTLKTHPFSSSRCLVQRFQWTDRLSIRYFALSGPMVSVYWKRFCSQNIPPPPIATLQHRFSWNNGITGISIGLARSDLTQLANGKHHRRSQNPALCIAFVRMTAVRVLLHRMSGSRMARITGPRHYQITTIRSAKPHQRHHS